MLALTGCGPKDTATQPGDSSTKPVVISANYPLHYCAQRLGGNSVQAVFPVPPDVDPAFWVPTSEDIGNMQEADLVLLNGAGYEQWLPKVTLAESKLVDTSAGLRDQLILEDAGPSHQHGPGGKHTHGGVAFTTWLDLSLAMQQAVAVERALARLSPDHAAQFSANLASLTNDLASLDKELLAWGKSVNGQPLIASHPVYQYFARHYELNLKSVHWEPDEVPDEAAWQELEAMLKDHPAQWMIWEGEPLPSTISKLRDRGVACRVFAPCGNAPKAGDFLSVMQENVNGIRD